ncbi:MAG: aspartate aminotransferase family protein [Ruminococcaceae bacterium]|nr:aspartate aminotransferase family protein [Oscillospiraceae bacterium]
MNLQAIMDLDERYYMNTFGKRTPVCFTKGKGIYVYDTEGKKYVDFLAGIAVNALGHSHKILKKALHKQVNKLIHTSSLYYIENQAKLAEKIVHNSAADKVFFANSGAEANEGAIKLAKIYFYKKNQPEKHEIITLDNSFHGRTLACVAATGQEKYQKPYKPLTPGFIHVPANDFEALSAVVTENTAAIMMELIQGESGVRPLEQDYVDKVVTLCKEKDILLIVDEIQTGMGRTGALFCYENYGITPDIFTLAKALGGGVPIGAVCAKADIAAGFEPGDHGTTFGGNPLATAAGLAVFQAFEEEKLVENSRAMGKYFKEQLVALQVECKEIQQVRGMGLMIGIECRSPVAKVIQLSLLDKGYVIGTVGDRILRLVPPLIIDKKIINQFIKDMQQILQTL